MYSNHLKLFVWLALVALFAATLALSVVVMGTAEVTGAGGDLLAVEPLREPAPPGSCEPSPGAGNTPDIWPPCWPTS